MFSDQRRWRPGSYERTPQGVRRKAHARDAELVAQGALVGMAGRPVRVRNPEEGGVEMTPCPYLRSDLPVAGFALIEAATLEDAVAMISGSPCAVAHGIVEVWPMETPGD